MAKMSKEDDGDTWIIILAVLVIGYLWYRQKMQAASLKVQQQAAALPAAEYFKPSKGKTMTKL